MTGTHRPGAQSVTDRLMPPAPAVQRLGGALLVQGPAVADLARLLPRAVADAARRDGIAVPDRLRLLLAMVAEAAAASACPAADVRVEAGPARWLTTSQVADRLGLDERQVRRLGVRIGGYKARGGWLFDTREIEKEQRRRKPA